MTVPSAAAVVRTAAYSTSMSQTAQTVVVPAPEGTATGWDVAPPPGLRPWRPWRAWRRLRSRTRNLVASTSMVATDVTPTRMGAAKAAARTFIDTQPESIKVGVVTFGGVGVVVQQPTTDKTAVLGAIDRLTPSGGTAVGAGILTALSAIAGEPIGTEDPSADPSSTDQGSGTEIGYHGGTAVIMLTDGENTEQPDPLTWPTWPRWPG